VKGKWVRLGLGLGFLVATVGDAGCGACELLFVAIKYAKVVTHTHTMPPCAVSSGIISLNI